MDNIALWCVFNAEKQISATPRNGGIMINERITLSDDGRAYLDTYVTFNTSATPRPAMLILPGGGYHGVSPREGEPIALAFMARGYNAFVLNYRVGAEDDVYPRQLIDASRAMIHIRENAEKYNTLKDKVTVLGFSAGGHLAGSLATMHNEPEILEKLGISEGENRPDSVVLCYPVITALHQTHQGSFKNLLGKPFDEITEEEKLRFSIEERVNCDTPPTFIWHTAKDKGVPPIGSLRLAERLIELDVPVAVRIYPYGGHGISLGTKETTGPNDAHVQPIAANWVRDVDEWLLSL